jgi:arsenite-transporting ATPase
VAALADPAHTRLVLVARAQPATLREAARTHAELAAIGLRQQFLVVNGVPPGEGARPSGRRHVPARAGCAGAMPQACRRCRWTRWRSSPSIWWASMPCASCWCEAAPVTRCCQPQRGAPACDLRPASPGWWTKSPADGHGLVMLMGKGGVGKTTLAAAVAVALAHRGLCGASDHLRPGGAPHGDAGGTLEHLSVSRIDPHEVTERYRQQVLSTKGAGLDAAGRACSKKTCARRAPRRSRCFRRSRG